MTEAAAHPSRERITDSMGMWVFLATETMMFGVLFFVFLVYRGAAGYALGEASRALDMIEGGVNTAVLLTSSLTMALAVLSARDGHRVATSIRLFVTAALGILFLAIKLHEWLSEADKGILPHIGPGAEPSGPQIFFNFYFAATGLHAIHLTVGIALVILLAVRQPDRRPAQVEMTGLYWHFVDVVWVFLYPVLYLVGRSA